MVNVYMYIYKYIYLCIYPQPKHSKLHFISDRYQCLVSGGFCTTSSIWSLCNQRKTSMARTLPQARKIANINQLVTDHIQSESTISLTLSTVFCWNPCAEIVILMIKTIYPYVGLGRGWALGPGPAMVGDWLICGEYVVYMWLIHG